MLFRRQSLFKLRCIKPHKLTEGLKTNAMANIFHPLFVSYNVVIQSLKAWYFSD